MSKQIKISNDVILELDKIRDNRLSYTQAIRELIARVNNNNINKIILEQLEIIKESISNRTNQY